MLKFLAKTVLYGIAPEAFARIRSARSLRGAPYSKTVGPAFEGDDSLKTRKYASYADYLSHQAEKYTLMLGRSGGLGRRALVSYRLKFFRRFYPVARHLKRSSTIVCAGARDGTEVEVWRDLGFPNTIGYDLNPGPDNPFVLHGDFNKLPVIEDAADLYYSNAVDHAFDLDMMFTEARRILRPKGIALFDVGVGEPMHYETQSWKRPEITILKLLAHFEEIMSVERHHNWMFVTLRKTPRAPE